MHILIIPSEHFLTSRSPLGGIFQMHRAKALCNAGHQVGVLFGSYVKKGFLVKDGLMSNQKALVDKIILFEEYMNRYDNNSEIFGYEQRVINGTLNGDRAASHFTDMLSPFYDRTLIEFCLTIPDIFKKDEAIYLDWFNEKHKKIAEYKWESAGIKPKQMRIVKYAKKIKRYKNAFLRRIGLNINDMNPFDVWLRKNKRILKNLDGVFNELINNIEDKNLKEILNKMYLEDIKFSHYGRNNKFIVITLLVAHKLHFEVI